MADIPAIITGTNADLIRAVAQLGYVAYRDDVLDMTYGRGAWWKLWAPEVLSGLDLNNPDFRHTGYPDAVFDVVAFDPPYRLNGTPDRGDFDKRYGIDVPMRWQDKHQLIKDGINEGLRVLRSGGRLLLKCQDQVCSGQVRWQTHEFARHAEHVRFRPTLVEGRVLPDFTEVRDARLVDMLHLLRPVRPQPPGRAQVHARRNYSSLLILEKAT